MGHHNLFATKSDMVYEMMIILNHMTAGDNVIDLNAYIFCSHRDTQVHRQEEYRLS